MRIIRILKPRVIRKETTTPFDHFVFIIDRKFPYLINQDLTKNYTVEELIPYVMSKNILLPKEVKSYGLHVLMPYRNIGIIIVEDIRRLRNLYQYLKRNENYHPQHSEAMEQSNKLIDLDNIILDYDISVGLDLKDRIRIGSFKYQKYWSEKERN